MVQPVAALARFLATRSATTLNFAPGIATPGRFSDSRLEHLTARRAAGLFDFSFMGCAQITGAACRAFINGIQTRALDHLPGGRIAYTLLLRDDGSVLNDATVWCLGDDRYWLFTGRRKDFEHVASCAADFDVTVADISGGHAVLALQGAASWSIVERCFPGQNIAPLPYYGFRKLDFSGNECWLARIGYCGETGCELVIADAAAPVLWQALLTAGAGAGLTECGFDAIDTLRIEAGHILFTRELATPVTPFELGLARLVDFYRPPFRGAQPLRAQRWREPARRMVGVVPASRAAMSQRLPAHIAPGNAVATSTCWSPVLGCNLGIGFVNAADARPGALLRLADGVRARVARLPFYDLAKYLPRRTP